MNSRREPSTCCHHPQARSSLVSITPRLAIAVLTLAQAVGACAARDLGLPPGVSDAPAGRTAESAPSDAGPIVHWEHFQKLGEMKVLLDTFASRGHGTGEWNAQLRANEMAARSFDSLRSLQSMPRGALLAQLHTLRAGGTPTRAFVMEKREDGYFPEGGNWDFAVAGPSGVIIARGQLGSCARCHAEAPVDFVFPRPMTNR